MLWQHYVFRRAQEVHPTWEILFERRKVRLLYIAGCGFDVRAQIVMKEFVQGLRESRAEIEDARLLLVGFTGYRLDDELKDETKINETALTEIFRELGPATGISVGSSSSTEDISASAALRQGFEEVLLQINVVTDVVLDVSSLPRVVYLSLLTGILSALIPNKDAPTLSTRRGLPFKSSSRKMLLWTRRSSPKIRAMI
jgi:hypothetical protein